MTKIPTGLKTAQNKQFITALKNRFGQAELFLVGGIVRDAFLNKPTKDIDLVIRNVGKAQLEEFLATQGKVNLVGKKFGVFKFMPQGWTGPEIDIALPRTEHSISLNGGYKDFKINSNAKLKIEDDLSRRDFTINAMAWDITNQKLIDPFDGFKDLTKGAIKAVGRPELRFKEDYSRMLRAIRFSCQLDFKIEQTTWKAIIKEIKKLNKIVAGERIVPHEVIAKELVKAISANPLKAIDLLDKGGVLKVLMPELLKMKGCPQPRKWHTEGDCWQHTLLAIANLESQKFKKEFPSQPITAELLWGLLFHDLGKPYTIKRADRLRFNNHDNVSAKKFEEIARRLKLSSAGLDIDKVSQLIAKHMLPTHSKSSEMKDTTIEKYFFNPDFPGAELMMLIFADISATIPKNGKPDFTEYLIIKKRIAKLAEQGRGQKLPKPLVNGKDLIKKFKLKSGPQIGKLLNLAREAQLAGKIKTKTEVLKMLTKKIKS